MLSESQLRAAFESEYADLLTRAESLLLDAERRAGEVGDIDGLMRCMHTIKSSSASMGYRSLSELAHAAEDFIGDAKKGGRAQDTEFFSALLAVIDALRGGLAAVSTGGGEPDCAPLIARLRGTSAGAVTAVAVAPGDDTRVTISVGRLDALMAVVEEFLGATAGLRAATVDVPAAGDAVRRVERAVDELRHHVTQARLTPLSQAMARFPRMVRDLSATVGKPAVFRLEGGDVEFDRDMLRRAAEPLLHLVRNAVDHGISAAGGAVVIRGTRLADRIRLEVENDGVPIDFGRIRDAAVAAGVVGAEAAAALDERGVRELLWYEGVSTAPAVTETSGRGLGMPIVRRFAREVGGTVEVESPRAETGDGTRITLTLPLSVAIIPALIVTAGGRPYALPYSLVERAVRVPAADIASVADQDATVVDGEQLPLVHLDRITDPPAHVREPPGPHDLQAVVVAVGGSRAGIAVDALLGRQELVVRPLPDILRGIAGFSGTATLGDGRVALVIEPQSLLADPALFRRLTHVSEKP